MRLTPLLFVPCAWCLIWGTAGTARGELAAELTEAVEQLASIDAGGKVAPQHRVAWQSLAKAPVNQLTDLLRAVEANNPIANNWILSAADALASDALTRGEKLPIDDFEQLVRDQQASSPGRRAAYEWIRKIDPERADRLLDSLRDDPNLDIRRDAVGKLLATIKSTPLSDPGREAMVREALRTARDLEQIRACKRNLAEYDETLQLARHLGFVTRWRLIGPFDNSGGKGFDAVYPPENEIDFDAGYEGKGRPVAWREELVTTDHELGDVDIVGVVGPVKGAVVYLYAELVSSQDRPAEVRYASTNATKLWVNGEQVADHEVYHAGNQYDQYVHPVSLKQGKNTLLLKVCQNEQKESWAQGWQFMLRVTDELGGAIPLENTTSAK